jgi:hypothetical protein
LSSSIMSFKVDIKFKWWHYLHLYHIRIQLTSSIICSCQYI